MLRNIFANVFTILIRRDYADAFSLNGGSAQTNVHFALQSLDFFLFSRFFEMVSSVFDKMIRWDYADAFSLNRGSAQTNVHFALQSLDFFCFLRFLK